MERKTELTNSGSAHDGELEQALRNFRSSVHAWGEAEYSRPHHPERVVRLTSWRVASGWALGCVVVLVTVSGGLLEHHHKLAQAKVVAAEAAMQQAQVKQQRASIKDEDLLAKVDSDLSRQVPREMEPLAQLMTDEDEQ